MVNHFRCNLLWIELYDQSGNRVSNGVMNYQPDYSYSGYDYARIRSGNEISLADLTNYTVKVRSADSSTTGYIVDAKLVVAQAAGGGITDTETSIELGNSETTTGTSYAMLASPKVYYYDSANFSGTPSIYFEASMKGSTGGVTARATLSSTSTCSDIIPGSEVSVTGATWTLSRSEKLSIIPSDREYFVCFKTSSGTASMANAKLIIDLTGTLDKIQTVQQLLNASATDNDSSYTPQNPLNLLTKANFAGDDIHYYYEAVMKTSSGTGYTQLYNSTDAGAVTGSELSTTSTTFERKYTSDLDSNLTTAKDYLSQIKGGASSTATISNAWLIIQIGAPEANQTVGPTYNNTVGPGVKINPGTKIVR